MRLCQFCGPPQIWIFSEDNIVTIATPFQKRWQAAGYTEQTPIQTAVYQP
ncbi:ATP-dependent helicase, partial [Lactiplantibacillus plantarum]